MYRMLQEKEEEPHAPRQSGSFKALQDIVEHEGTLASVVSPGKKREKSMKFYEEFV